MDLTSAKIRLDQIRLNQIGSFALRDRIASLLIQQVDIIRQVAEMSSSLAEECTQVKERYDSCFLKWYSESEDPRNVSSEIL